MTDNVIKSLQWLIFNFPKVENPKDESDKICNCINLYCTNAVDLLKRQNAEVERLQKLQKPTETSGFKIENGKVVFYTNILNGYRHEYKDQNEVVKELNLMLHNAYKQDEIISHYKSNERPDKDYKFCNLLENALVYTKTLEDYNNLRKAFKAAAIKEFAERLKEKATSTFYEEHKYIDTEDVDNLVKEMTE